MRQLLIALPLSLLALHALAGEHHVHGQAEMDIAIDGGTIELELRSPQFNLAGFEHSPRKAPDQAMAVTVRRQLEQPQKLLGLDGCQLTGRDLDGTLMNVDVHAATTVDDDEHPNVTAMYQFECSTPPKALDLTGLFKQFAHIEKVKVELIGPKGQTAATLTPAASKLDI